MKINWGYRVTILYIGFVGLIAYLVTRSMNEKVDLVSTDYYAQELKYQDKIESIERNNLLLQPTVINYGPAGVIVTFPMEFKETGIAGTIHLFRPSDDTKDMNYEIVTNENMTQIIPASELIKGMYRVKVEYTCNEQKYYTEKQIVIK